jgi:hypothetical protein
MSDMRSPSLDATATTANNNDAAINPANSNSDPKQANQEAISALVEQLGSAKETTQAQAITDLAAMGELAIEPLIDFLLQRCRANQTPTYLDGKAYQVLLGMNSALALEAIATHFPKGIVSFAPEVSLDLELLQSLLARQDYQAADQLTSQKMCAAAGSGATERGWLYFTDVDQIAPADLAAIDQLWLVYSENKFGFSVQRKLWLSVGKNWEKLWQKIGWKKDGKFTRYPDGFSWDISAPRGHLPLSNQIRGNKTITAIFSHRLWQG